MAAEITFKIVSDSSNNITHRDGWVRTPDQHPGTGSRLNFSGSKATKTLEDGDYYFDYEVYGIGDSPVTITISSGAPPKITKLSPNGKLMGMKKFAVNS